VILQSASENLSKSSINRLPLLTLTYCCCIISSKASLIVPTFAIFHLTETHMLIGSVVNVLCKTEYILDSYYQHVAMQLRCTMANLTCWMLVG